MTERLYYSDSYLREFEARIVEKVFLEGRPGVILDRTAFYPASGGQPHDTGRLECLPVIEVIEREDKAVVHITAAEISASLGKKVCGEIDWARRFDHMQQHTGQHILSQAFLSLFEAKTVSFHLGEEVSTIDIDRAPLSLEELEEAEEAANAIVFEDRPVRASFLSEEELARLPLRKMPAVEGPVRLVIIEDFDHSPCGGTHCRHTGEVGLIAIGKVERRGDQTRLEFRCGRRALADYRRKNRAVNELAGSFSVGDWELPQAVARLREQEEAQRRALHSAMEKLLDYEAARLVAGAEDGDGFRLVQAIFQPGSTEEALPWDAERVRHLALRIVEHPSCVALLGLRGDKARLTFARSKDLDFDMAALLREVSPLIGGGGGGQPYLAQGGGARTEGLEEALEKARKILTGK